MNEQRIRELTARINDALDELAEEFPNEGFVIVGLTSVEGQTGVTTVFNVDEEDLPEILEGICNGSLEALPPPISGRH
ncbi:MAG: hypothetical protein KJZ83_00520 [Burkholderiaceae bacterium]|nr:hypothetical protein [Burkholderiaceae bacterium]